MQLCIGGWRPQYLQAPLVPAAFSKQAAATPDSPCLVSEDGTFLTFAQTNAAATALARRLAARGVGKDVAVGILLDRSPAVVVSMIAIHKVGVPWLAQPVSGQHFFPQVLMCFRQSSGSRPRPVLKHAVLTVGPSFALMA